MSLNTTSYPLTEFSTEQIVPMAVASKLEGKLEGKKTRKKTKDLEGRRQSS